MTKKIPSQFKGTQTAKRIAPPAPGARAEVETPRRRGREKREDLWRTNLGLTLEQKAQLEQLADRVYQVTRCRPTFAGIVRAVLAAGLPAAAKLKLDELATTAKGLREAQAEETIEKWFAAQLGAR